MSSLYQTLECIAQITTEGDVEAKRVTSPAGKTLYNISYDLQRCYYVYIHRVLSFTIVTFNVSLRWTPPKKQDVKTGGSAQCGRSQTTPTTLSDAPNCSPQCRVPGLSLKMSTDCPLPVICVTFKVVTYSQNCYQKLYLNWFFIGSQFMKAVNQK